MPTPVVRRFGFFLALLSAFLIAGRHRVRDALVTLDARLTRFRQPLCACGLPFVPCSSNSMVLKL